MQSTSWCWDWLARADTTFIRPWVICVPAISTLTCIMKSTRCEQDFTLHHLFYFKIFFIRWVSGLTRFFFGFELRRTQAPFSSLWGSASAAIFTVVFQGSPGSCGLVESSFGWVLCCLAPRLARTHLTSGWGLRVAPPKCWTGSSCWRLGSLATSSSRWNYH